MVCHRAQLCGPRSCLQKKRKGCMCLFFLLKYIIAEALPTSLTCLLSEPSGIGSAGRSRSFKELFSEATSVASPTSTKSHHVKPMHRHLFLNISPFSSTVKNRPRCPFSLSNIQQKKKSCLRSVGNKVFERTLGSDDLRRHYWGISFYRGFASVSGKKD